MQRFINNWSASLLQPLAADATTLVVDPSAAARLVGLGGGDYYLLTLIGTDELGNEITWEIVRVTAAVSGSLTIDRAQEGTAARAWPTAAAIEMRITAGAMAGLRDTPGPAGPQGDPGLSAYGVALADGFAGTEAEWLESLRGDDGQDGAAGASAYEIAVASGFVGDEATWLASLQGEPGEQGEQGPPGPQGQAGSGLKILGTLPSSGGLPVSGEPGDGYLIGDDLWVWSVDQWVNAGPIRGPQGPVGPTGPVGTTGSAGADGASAYQIAVANGFSGSEAEWLLSLKGEQGEQGEQGPPGTSGTQSIIVACSDETTALTAGAAKVTFRMPYPFVLLGVRASLTAEQVSGNILTVDLNEDGVSVLSTKLTVDNGEKTSTTAATAAVISDSALADDAEMTVDIDQIGDGTAKGLKVTLLGYRP